MRDAHRRESGQPRLAIVQITHPDPDHPRVRITRAMPDGFTPAQAIALAQARARADSTRRFQVLEQQPESPEARLLWDSHAPS